MELVDECKQIHRDCVEFLKHKDYPNFETFVRSKIKGNDVEKLNKMTMILSLIKEHPYVQYTYTVLSQEFQKLENKIYEKENSCI